MQPPVLRPVPPVAGPLVRSAKPASSSEKLGRQLLRRMVRAELTLSYLAREVATGVGNRTVEQWVKRDPKQGIRRESIKPEGILLVDNRKRQFLVNTRERRYQESRSQLNEVQKRFSEALQTGKAELTVLLQGQDTIAGRLAEVVLVQPTPPAAGPSRRFWVDRETGLRLRTEERAPDGRILSNTYYLSLELNPTLRPDEFEPPPVPIGFRRIADTQKRYVTFDEASREGVTIKQPSWLPAGFRLRRITVGTGLRALTNVQWGNELTALSLVSAQGAPPPMIQKLLKGSESGVVQLPSGERAYAWRLGDGYAMVIGSLPDDQLKKIADSVH